MSKEKVVPKAIDKNDVSKTILMIVDLLISIDSSRELINQKVKYLKDTYGLNSTNVRAAATAIKKENEDELVDKLESIQGLIELCTS